MNGRELVERGLRRHIPLWRIENEFGLAREPSPPLGEDDVCQQRGPVRDSHSRRQTTTPYQGGYHLEKENIASIAVEWLVPHSRLDGRSRSVAPQGLSRALLREGFELETAVSGLECVARLREAVPDVLVLEPHMPWGGGDGVLRSWASVRSLRPFP